MMLSSLIRTGSRCLCFSSFCFFFFLFILSMYTWGMMMDSSPSTININAVPCSIYIRKETARIYTNQAKRNIHSIICSYILYIKRNSLEWNKGVISVILHSLSIRLSEEEEEESKDFFFVFIPFIIIPIWQYTHWWGNLFLRPGCKYKRGENPLGLFIFLFFFLIQ